MAELTDDDVLKMKQFLTDTCADVKRWLPEPEWSPGWQSDAAGEWANSEQGPGGPWGPDIVRSVYVAAAMFLEAVLQCMQAMAASITVDSTHYVPDCLARAAMEAGSQAFSTGKHSRKQPHSPRTTVSPVITVGAAVLVNGGARAKSFRAIPNGTCC